MLIRWLTIFLDVPRDSSDAAVDFWTAVTGTTLSPWRGDVGEFATLEPANGDAHVRAQQVHDGPGGSHLDVHVDLDTDSLDSAAARAQSLGARVTSRLDDVVVVDSPGGFTFCLVPWNGESLVPSPVETGDAGVSRLDQLCLDVPPDRFDAETEFWTALTGWKPRSASRPEFRGLVQPEGMPVRLLFQRMDEARPGAHVSAHLDFACSDYTALIDHHVASGAQALERFPFWATMSDPAGRVYCLTARDPRTGRLRLPT